MDAVKDSCSLGERPSKMLCFGYVIHIDKSSLRHDSEISFNQLRNLTLGPARRDRLACERR